MGGGEVEILLKVRNGVGGVLPGSGGRAHGVIVGSVLWIERDGFLEGIPCFGNKVQIETNETKIVMQAGIRRFELARMRQVAERTLIVPLLVGHARQLQQRRDRKISASNEFFERGTGVAEPIRALVSKAQRMQTCWRQRLAGVEIFREGDDCGIALSGSQPPWAFG